MDEAPLAYKVALGTLAVLSYRLLFQSTRDLSLTAMLFCCACAWCVGQLVAAAVGETQLRFPAGLSAPVSTLASLVRTACQNAGMTESARASCWRYTAWALPEQEP